MPTELTTEVTPDAGSGAAARIAGYDVARAVAICLMVLENFKVLMLGVWQDPHVLVWLAGLTDGRSAPLFVTLAGVGMALMSRDALASGDRAGLAAVRRVLLRRALVLLGMGNLFILVWSMDILHFYAAYIALAALTLLGATKRTLLASAAAVVLFSTALLYARGELFFESFDYWSPTGVLRDTFLDGIHPVFPWIAFIIVGLWLGRWRLDQRGPRRVVLYGALAVALGAELLSDLLQHLTFVSGLPVIPASFPQLFGTRLSPPGPLYVISASATSAAAIAACLELAERAPRQVIVRALTAAGQLSLSLYIAHAIVGAGLLWALGRLEDHSIWFLLGYWGGYTALSVVAAAAWRRRWRLGPLEWALRRLSGPSPRSTRTAATELAPAAPPASASSESTVPRWVVAARAGAVLGAGWLISYSLFGLGPPRWGCPPVERTLAPGRAVSAEITVACRDRGLDFVIDSAAEQAFVIEVSSGADTYAELFAEGAEEPWLEDDDSGPGYCPRLSGVLPAGRYRLLVRPYRAGTGPFRARALLSNSDLDPD